MKRNTGITEKLLGFFASIDKSLDGGMLLFDRPALYRKMSMELRRSKVVTNKDRKNTGNSIYYALKRGYLSQAEKNKGDYLYITDQGRDFYRLRRLNTAVLRQAKKWDGEWRLVLFDIPSVKRGARDALRRMLKRLGFRQIQKSVWVTPCECEEAVSLIKEFFHLSDDEILMIETEKIGNTQKLRKIFKL